MDGENPQRDFKLAYNPADPLAQLGLVKDLIALANAGGGEIIFGRSEAEIVGIETPAAALDSARLADAVARYAAPATVHIEHADTLLDDGRILRTVRVAPVEYPIVMAVDGNYPSSGRTQSAFRKGDMWTRHSSKTERATYEDLRAWIDRARQAERDAILGRINKVINLPDGAEIQIVPPAAVPALDTPQRMLEYAAKRRQHNVSYVLTGDDLLWLFVNREDLKGKISPDELSLVVASALRRSPTLFWWLTLADDRPEIVLRELLLCLSAADRDKSDAAKSVTELAAVYADDAQLQDLIADLRHNRYQHFREAVQDWSGRAAPLERLRGRIERAKHSKQRLCEMGIDELEHLATEFAVECLANGSAQGRRLGDITRVIWSRRSDYARGLI